MVKTCSWDVVQNALCQSDCSIFKRTKSPEQINEITWYFACWYQFKKIKFWLIIFWVEMVENVCGQSGYETLKLNVSQQWKFGTNWFFK